MSNNNFVKFNDAIENIDDYFNEEIVDIVVLPPEKVDEITDEEDNQSPFLLNNVNELNVCDTVGKIEITNSSVSSTFENLNQKIIANWKKSTCNNSFKIPQKQVLCLPKFDLHNGSYDIFNKLIDDKILMKIVKESNIYATQKNQHNFHLSLKELKNFIGILILSGYHRLPRQNMYWETSDDSGVQLVKKIMTHKRFKEIKRFIHFSDNTKLDSKDKLSKLRPLIDMLNKNFKQFGFFEKIISIDEQMVPYFGRHSSKMFIKGKPVRFGFKIWVMASKSGYIYSFKVYCGKDNTRDKFGVGRNVVMNFVNEIDNFDNVEIYFDNFFSSYSLFKELNMLKIFATGTVRPNRIAKCPLEALNNFKKKPRGSFEEYHDENQIFCCLWNDTKPVIIMSNAYSSYPLVSVKRYSKTEKKYIQINQPQMFNQYNKNMGGVDLADNAIANYRICIKSKKWYWPLFTNFISMSIVNSWKLVNLSSTKKIDLLEHIRIIVSTMTKPKELPVIRRRSNISYLLTKNICPKPIITRDINKKRLRCVICHKITIYYCEGCSSRLHAKCFNLFHT